MQRTWLLAAIFVALCAVQCHCVNDVHGVQGKPTHLLPFKDVSRRRGWMGVSFVAQSNVALKGQFPHQVGIVMDEKEFCSGAIITKRWILTAAHCIENTINWVVFVGTNDIGLRQERHRQVYETKKGYIPPDYHFPQNDIAVIRLPQDLKLNEYVKVIPLVPGPPEIYIGRPATLSGYGPTAYDRNNTRLYYTPNLKIINTHRCAEQYGEGAVFKPSVGCLVRTKGSAASGVCEHDSGSPVLVRDSYTGVLRLYGIVSFVGAGGCQSELPIGISNVPYNVAWVEGIVGGSLTK